AEGGGGRGARRSAGCAGLPGGDPPPLALGGGEGGGRLDEGRGARRYERAARPHDEASSLQEMSSVSCGETGPSISRPRAGGRRLRRRDPTARPPPGTS